MTIHEETQLKVLDVLLSTDDGVWRGDWKNVLPSLAIAVYGEDAIVGSPEYKRVSLAVLALEQAELVAVERAYEARSSKANIITKIELT